MCKRGHHRKIISLLRAMDADFLRATKCYFGGGTAISLLLDEFRESTDIDFLCADQAGYCKLRESVFDRGFSDLFPGGVEILREIRADRDGIRAFLVVDGTPIKFEIVREARIDLNGEIMPGIPVTCLSKTDLFAEKLLANADRYNDNSVMSRDVIDLIVMEGWWGGIPQAAWDKAQVAYGESVRTAFDRAMRRLAGDQRSLDGYLAGMGIDEATGNKIKASLAEFCREDLPDFECR